MAKISCVVVLVLFAISGVLSGPRRHISRNYDYDDYIPLPRSPGYGRIGLSALTAFANPLLGLGIGGHGGHGGHIHDNHYDKDRHNFWSYPQPHRTHDYYHDVGSAKGYGSYGGHHGHGHRHRHDGYPHDHRHSNRYHNYDHSEEYDDYY